MRILFALILVAVAGIISAETVYLDLGSSKSFIASNEGFFITETMYYGEIKKVKPDDLMAIVRAWNRKHPSVSIKCLVTNTGQAKKENAIIGVWITYYENKDVVVHQQQNSKTIYKTIDYIGPNNLSKKLNNWEINNPKKKIASWTTHTFENHDYVNEVDGIFITYIDEE